MKTPRRRIIENRQALLDYDATPQQTLDYLKRQLGVTHNHQQEARDKKPNLPTTLDPKQVSRDVYERDALGHDDSLSGLSQDALESLVRTKAALSAQQRRALLSKLQRPDVPNLPEFIITDLQTRESRGFGEFGIHRALLPAQLDALVKAIPALAKNDAFVQTRLRKLAPSPDVDVDVRPGRARGVARSPVGLCQDPAAGLQHAEGADPLSAARPRPREGCL